MYSRDTTCTNSDWSSEQISHGASMLRWMARAQAFLRGRRNLLVWIPITLLIQNDVATLMSVTGRSMSPTLNPHTSRMNDVVVIDRWHTFPRCKWRRGEVVVLRSPTTNELIVKRILALEGDKVHTLPPYPDAVVRIPGGHVWVEGDEPFHTLDSNSFGPVSLGLIYSKVPWIVFPLSRWGPVSQSSPHQTWDASRVERRRADLSVPQEPEMIPKLEEIASSLL